MKNIKLQKQDHYIDAAAANEQKASELVADFIPYVILALSYI